MKILFIIFWCSLALLFYCYIGYGLLVYFLKLPGFRSRKKNLANNPGPAMPVTMIIAAYNEEQVIKEKIRTSLEIVYHPGLKLIVVTDGSNDNTHAIAQGFPGIMVLHESERKGKYAAIKRAMEYVQTPIVVFSDANSMLNPDSITNLVRHFEDPGVGAVAGEKKIQLGKTISAVGEAEGFYWRYESFMKKLDASLYTVTGAAGELYAIRRNLFISRDDGLILDDFVTSMQVCLLGYRIAYEPAAYATELPSISLQDEEKRKLRISAGAYQSIGYLRECMNFFKHPVLAFQFITRRLFRWTLCPFLIVLVFIINLIIAINTQSQLYNFLMLAQLVFYALAFAGWFFLRSGKRAGVLSIPFYFVFMNYCLIKGFVRFLQKKQTVLWDKSSRAG